MASQPRQAVHVDSDERDHHDLEADVAVTSPADVRPLVLGYLRVDALTTERELARSAAELASYLHRKGYTLGTVFVERTEKVPAAFEALMAEADRTGVDAVVMPGPPPKIIACARTGQPATLPTAGRG